METSYEVISSHDDGNTKVVEVLVSFEGAEGPTQETRFFEWHGAERYKASVSGKLIPKVGPDYKDEIRWLVNGIYSPKV